MRTHRQTVEARLQTEVRHFLPDYTVEEQQWGTDTNDRHTLQAYEFGSRCAFLAWRLIESGRLPEHYFDNNADLNSIPFQFQKHFNHGVINSLGIPKNPNEFFIHLLGVMEVGHVQNKRELIEWLERNIDITVTWGRLKVF